MKNWRTFLAGLGLALVQPVNDLLTQGNTSPKVIITSCLIALFGYLAKDKDVTGLENTPETPAK